MATTNNRVIQKHRIDTEANWLAASVANRTIYEGEIILSTFVDISGTSYTGAKINDTSSTQLFESLDYDFLFTSELSGILAANSFVSNDGGLKFGGSFQAGSFPFTDSNWGFLLKPSVAGLVGAFAVQNSSGGEILKILEGKNFYAQGVYDNTTASAANVFVASNGNLLRSTSSIRYKKDLQNVVSESNEIDLDNILNIDVVTFDSIVDKVDTRYFGVTAEKLHELFGHYLVTYNEKGEPDAVQYDRLGPLVIAYLQKKKFDERIKALEEENKSIKARLDALEA